MDLDYILWLTFVLLVFAGIPAVNEYLESKNIQECKIAALAANKSAEEITKICKK